MALALASLMVVGSVIPFASGQATVSNDSGGQPKVSYNPGVASRYHAPISGMGLVAVTKSYAFLKGGSLTQPTAGTSAQPQKVPAGLTWFINDSSYAPQSETSIAVDPANSQHVVGGYNDARWFFCPSLRAAECPNGYSKSVTGFTTSIDGGAAVAKSGDLPGITIAEKNLTSGASVQSLLYSWGDPSLAQATDGTFYFSSLAIDPVTGASGVMIQKSNSNLFSPGSNCQSLVNTPDTNHCWTAQFISGNLTFQCIGPGLCGTFSLEDKDTIAVDTDPTSPYFGYAYVAWDHFYSNGESAAYLAICSPSLSCTMLSGGAAPVVSGTDKYAGNATPMVGPDGTVYLTWCNFGTATAYGPVYCSVRSSPAGGGSFGTVHSVMSFMGTGTQLAGDTVIIGFATEQFRTSSIPTIIAGSGGDVYFAIPLCVSGFYYRFNNIPTLPTDNPGNCGTSAVFFTKSMDGGATWSSPVEASSRAVVIQPDLAYDSKTGAVILSYYTSQFDPFNHRIDVGVAVSRNRGQSFSFVRATPVSNEPNSDPSNYNYAAINGFGGSFVVPQYGDYFTAVALGGRIWVLFTGNYAQVQGTYKESPFLTVVGETPTSLNLSANSRDTAPGDRVTFKAGGFTAGSTLALSLNWNGVTISLANATVSKNGLAQGNFTVPNIQSQVYTVVANDGKGFLSTATLGVGQVSLGGVQGTLTSLQSMLGSLGGSVSNGFASLNASVTKARNTLGSSITGVGTSINSALSGSSSTLSIIEDLSLVMVVLLIVLIVLQFALRRGSKPEPQPHFQTTPPAPTGSGTDTTGST